MIVYVDCLLSRYNSQIIAEDCSPLLLRELLALSRTLLLQHLFSFWRFWENNAGMATNSKSC